MPRAPERGLARTMEATDKRTYKHVQRGGRTVNRVKTWVLIAALGGLFVVIGGLFWGSNGAVVALALGLVFNFAMYWYSDKIAIATTRSKPVTEGEHPELYRLVPERTQAKGRPRPRIYRS